jgi:hypothetical protein
MIVKHICFLMTAALTLSCRSHTVNASWSYDKNVGLAVVTAGHACLSINDPSLTPNTHVHVIDAQRQREMSAVIVSGRQTCGNDSAGTSGYAMRLDASDMQVPLIGIVVIGDGITFARRGTLLAGDLDRDRHDEFFRTCTSAEGVHATVWSDAPLTGTRRWHQYYALGYDVESTCTPAELSP